MVTRAAAATAMLACSFHASAITVPDTIGRIQAKDDLLARFNEAGTRELQSRRRHLSDCDTAYYTCLWDSGCNACIVDLSTTAIDDDYITDDMLNDMSCNNEFVEFLHDHDVCENLGTSGTSTNLFCEVLDACTESGDADDDYIDEECDPTTCSVTHEEYIGDGWCDYDTGGCYNSEGCGYDGGDCCSSTCVPSPSIACGDHGYECIDPGEQTSCNDDSLYTLYMSDSYGDGWDGAAYTIAEIQSAVQQATGTLTTGSEGTDTVCLLPGCYIMVLSAGSWASEISWSLDVDPMISGVAPTQCAFSVDGSFCDDLAGGTSQVPMCGQDTDDVPINIDDVTDDCTDNVYQLVLVDAYGDGWNGADYTLSHHSSSGNAGAEVSSGTLEDGFQKTESVCLANGCYTMTVDSGYWNSEITWEVGSATQGLVASSGAPVSCDFSVNNDGDSIFCANTCQPVSSSDDDDDDDDYYYYYFYGDDDCSDDDKNMFTIAMTDSYGDGWNGAHYTIKDGTTQVTSGTLDNGVYGEDMACLTDDVCYQVIVSSGSYGSEISWSIGKYGIGMVAAGEGPTGDMGCQFSTNGFCTTTCVVETDDDSSGCGSGMPGSGSSYDLTLYDSAGDGWDGAGYTVTNKASNHIEAMGTLISGASEHKEMCLPVGCYKLDVNSGSKDDEVSWFLSDAGISGGAPSHCQFPVGNPSNCASYCETNEDDDSGGGGGGGGGNHHCNTGQTIAGTSAMTAFQLCTDPSIKANDLTDTDDDDMGEKSWGKLDDFEACAFDETTADWPSSCMDLLNEAAASEDKLTKKIAKNLLRQGQAFCICSATSTAASPSCNSFKDFNAMLHESTEACNALDAVDCDYLRVYTEKCSQNLVDQFGYMDLSADGQCEYVDSGCGPGVSTPALRHWDCLDEEHMNPVQKTFIASYQTYCGDEEGDDGEGGSDDHAPKHDDHTPGVNDDPESKDKDAHEGHSNTHSVKSGGVAGAVFAVLGSIALVVCIGGGGLYWYKKHRQGGEGYVSGATTFSPMVFGGNKPGMTFNQLKTEVTTTELSSGAGSYTPVGVGATEGV